MATSPKRNKFENEGTSEEKVINLDETEGEIQDLHALDTYQAQLDEIDDELSAEMFSIEAKYANRKHEIYLKRSEIIKKVPNFWKLTIPNHPTVGVYVDQTSEEILQYLEDLFVEHTDKDAYKINFVFNENPYFYNKVLSKEYKILNRKANDCPVEITPATIMWKEGKEIPVGAKPCKNLIGWFQVNTDKDLQIAESIRFDLFANPLLYYLLKDNENGQEEHSDENGENEEMDDVVIVETDDEGDNSILEVHNSDSSDVAYAAEEDEDNKN